MQIIARQTLREFWGRHPRAEPALKLWFATVRRASWTGPADVRAQFNSADSVGDNRVIFDVGGNRYRLVTHVTYPFGCVLIKLVGTHAEYDKINPATV